ncbi:unnamed protein product, partial [marine sediment metagenome]
MDLRWESCTTYSTKSTVANMVRLPRKEGDRNKVSSPREVINVGKTGNRYTPRFQFQVVLEILKGDKEAVEIARAYGISPGTVSCWKQQFLNKGPELFGKDTTLAQYEKRISEL